MSRRIREFGYSDPQAATTARSAPAHLGILVVGPSGALLYANVEALRVLCFPETVKETALEETLRSNALKGKTSAMLAPLNTPFRVERCMPLMSGRRHYCCRQIAVRLQGERKAVLLIERAPSTSPLLPGLCSGHGLSSREREVVALLTQGFTNKEIAMRMTVTVNTVKAFVRCVMLKIGVSTRAGIVGRLFNESFRDETKGIRGSSPGAQPDAPAQTEEAPILPPRPLCAGEPRVVSRARSSCRSRLRRELRRSR